MSWDKQRGEQDTEVQKGKTAIKKERKQKRDAKSVCGIAAGAKFLGE